MSPATLSLLSGLGYCYDSSFIDDDAPYALDADGGAGMVELPLNHALIAASGYACLVLHPRGDIGVAREARLVMMRRFVERARGFGVRFRRCGECAAAARAR